MGILPDNLFGAEAYGAEGRGPNSHDQGPHPGERRQKGGPIRLGMGRAGP